MKFEKLGHIVTISKGKKHALAPKRVHQNFRYIQIEDLRNNDNLKFTDEKGVEVHGNDLIIAWDGANAGTIGFGLEGMIGSTLARLRIKENKEYNTDFIGYFLKGQFDYLRANATGATIPHIDRSSLESLKIPNIDFSEQYEIAKVLSKSEDLIKQRKENIGMLDKFLHNTFSEMFGDPVRNEKEWNTDNFGSCLSDILAGSSSTSKPPDDELSATPAKILRVSAVTSGRFKPNEYKDITFSQLGSTLVHPQQGDLLFSRANTRELVGATCIVYENYPDLHLPDKIWILFTNQKLSIYYTHYLFQNSSFRNILSRNATGTSGSMLNISMEKLRAQKIPIPDIELQNKFASLVTNAELLRNELIKSLNELENLFGSLNQRAFKGELEFKNISVKEIPNLIDGGKIIIGELSGLGASDKGMLVDTSEPKIAESKEIFPQKLSELIKRSEEDSLKDEPYFNWKVFGQRAMPRFSYEKDGDLYPLIHYTLGDKYFTFEDLKLIIIRVNADYEFEKLKNSVFDLLRRGVIKQVFADSNFKSQFTELHPDYEKVKNLNEQMYLQRAIILDYEVT